MGLLLCTTTLPGWERAADLLQYIATLLGSSGQWDSFVLGSAGRIPLHTTPQQCGGAQKETHCPLFPNNVALH